MAAAVMFGAVACSQTDEIQGVESGKEVETTFSLGLEALGTRLAGDSGMIDQVVWGIYEHQADGPGRFLPAHSSKDNGPADFDGQSAEIKVRLFTGKKYDLVFFGWCSTNTAYTIDWDNRKLEVNYNDNANVEARDAFYHIETAFVAGKNKTFTLKRPFAQLNVGQSIEDYDAMQRTDNYIAQSSVVAKAYKTMSLVDASVSDLVDVTLKRHDVINEDLEVNGIGYKHLSMNYLLVNDKEVLNEVKFEFIENDPANTGKPTVFDRTYYNVPLQRNYRTNILGNIISDEYDFEIIIDHRFVDQHNILFLEKPIVVNTNEELKHYLSHYIVGEVNVNSSATTTMNYIRMGDGTDAVFNMNNALVNTGTPADYGFIATGKANIVVNDGNFNSHGGGVGVTNGAKLTFSGDVYVDTASTSARYVFYTEGDGSELTVKGGNFAWDPNDNTKRAYVYASAGTTVRIEGGNFGKASSRSGYTAGILGPGTVIITGGVFGFNPSAWVASGYKAVQNGSKWYVVAENGALVNSAAELDAAIKNGETTIYIGSGEYNMPASAKGKTLELIGLGNPTISVVPAGQGEANGQLDYNLDGATVTFTGLTIKTNNNTYAGYARLTATFNNCTMENCFCLNGNSVFNDCTLNVSGDQYNIWTWGAPVATFTDCTFNCDGKAMLLYGQANTKLTMNNCVFNDKGGLASPKKTAIEIGNDYNKSYELIVNNATVNGFEENPNGIATGTTLWSNKNSMGQDKLNVVIDGVDVY